MQIREIKKDDNKQVASLIRGILEQMGVPKVGTAYADKALDDMFSAYQQANAVFYVAESNGKIVGCAGIAPLEAYDGTICELQKMYVDTSARGKGLANLLLKHCFESAMDFGYTGCYLETLPDMKAAQSLYIKNGFRYLDKPLGETGHSACTVRMLKTFLIIVP